MKTWLSERPDLLDHDGRPTDAIWAAFGAEVAAGDLAVMEDPHEALAALRRFLESTVARALDGLTLDALYALTREPAETPNWIGKSAARLQAVTREEPYRVRLAQVPAAAGDVLYDQILHHIQTATRSDDGNRLQLVELTYAFCADEILRSDPRGLEHVLASILPHASNPRLAVAIGTQLAALRAGRGSAAVEPRLSGNGVSPEIVAPRGSGDAPTRS